MELNLKDLTQEQLDNLKEQIKKQEEENRREFKIDYYNGYVIDTYEMTLLLTAHFLDSSVSSLADLGLYRDTKEEADKLLKKLLIHERLRRWSLKCKDKVDWNNKEQKKYYLLFNSDNNTLEGVVAFLTIRQDIYFTDESILEQAIEDIGEQTLINDYFVEV